MISLFSIVGSILCILGLFFVFDVSVLHICAFSNFMTCLKTLLRN